MNKNKFLTWLALAMMISASACGPGGYATSAPESTSPPETEAPRQPTFPNQPLLPFAQKPRLEFYKGASGLGEQSVAFTFPDYMPNWTIPIKAAPFANIEAYPYGADPSGYFIPIGLVEIGPGSDTGIESGIYLTMIDQNSIEQSIAGEIRYLTLRIYNSPYATGGENLLLRPVANVDFKIKTHMFFEPDTDFQFAGLVIYQDEYNYLQFGRAYCDLADICIGNGIYFDRVENGTWVEGNFATAVNSQNEAYLQLERQGEIAKASYSYDGINWFEVGTHRVPYDFQVNGVGLTASQDYNKPEPDIAADFDFFELDYSRDDFNGSLDEGWYWVNENTNMWYMNNVASRYPISFQRIPQRLNPGRFESGYKEFSNLGHPPENSVTITAGGICFIINSGDPSSGQIYTRYCSEIGSILSVMDNFKSGYKNLQSSISKAADVFGLQSVIQYDQVISEKEDPSSIERCSEKQLAGETWEGLQQECGSDITVAPVTEEYFWQSYDKAKSQSALPVSKFFLASMIASPLQQGSSFPVPVAVVQIHHVIETSMGSVLPGNYQVFYWFDSNGEFYAATISGFTTDENGNVTGEVIDQQVPAVPATFVNEDGTEQAGAQISACRIFGRCSFFQKTCP